MRPAQSEPLRNDRGAAVGRDRQRSAERLATGVAVDRVDADDAAARIAVVVNDLLRRRLSLGLVWLATRLLGCHPISRHDGPLSVRRAYSRDELRALAEKAGARRLTIREYPVLGRLLAVLS